MMDPLDQETNTTNDLSEKLLPDNIEPEDDDLPDTDILLRSVNWVKGINEPDEYKYQQVH